jgi:general secretion pathway protein G
MKMKKRNQKGFSLIELLVVLVILGLLAGLVLPNVMGKLGSAKFKAAKSGVTVLQAGIDSYALDVGQLPESLEELVEQPGNAEFWGGPYIKRQMLKDPWGNDWVYRRPGEHGVYDLISLGDDASPGGDGTASDINGWD